MLNKTTFIWIVYFICIASVCNNIRHLKTEKIRSKLPEITLKKLNIIRIIRIRTSPYRVTTGWGSRQRATYALFHSLKEWIAHHHCSPLPPRLWLREKWKHSFRLWNIEKFWPKNKNLHKIAKKSAVLLRYAILSKKMPFSTKMPYSP